MSLKTNIHKANLQMSVRGMTNKEKAEGYPPFNSPSWKKRKGAIAEGITRRHEASHARAVARKQAAGIETGTSTFTRLRMKMAQANARRIQEKKDRQERHRRKLLNSSR